MTRRVGVLAIAMMIGGAVVVVLSMTWIVRSHVGPYGIASGTGGTATTWSEPRDNGLTSPAVPLPDERHFAAELVDGTNARRRAAGLPALADSPCARAQAVHRAEALPATGPLAHAPLGPVTQACYPMRTAAENLVRAEVPAGDVVAAWMGSVGHRQNILDRSTTEVGAACVARDGAMRCSELFLGP